MHELSLLVLFSHLLKVQVTSGLDVTKLEHKVGVTELESDSHQVKAAYLTNYFRYLHSKLDQSLASLDVDADLHPAFKHGWVKSSPPELVSMLCRSALIVRLSQRTSFKEVFFIHLQS